MNTVEQVPEGLGEFADEADRLERRVLALAAQPRGIRSPDLYTIPAYMDRGVLSLVFKSRQPKTVLKLGLASLLDGVGGLDMEFQHRGATRSVTALQKGRGLERVEQLRAFRLANTPVIVAGHEPGQSFDVLSPHTLPGDAEPYRELVETWRAMERRGIATDGAGGNTLWSGRDFRVIDYLSVGDTDALEGPQDEALRFADILFAGSNRILPSSVYAFMDVCRSQFGREVAVEFDNMLEAHAQIFRGPTP